MKHTCLLFLLLVSGTLSLRAQINVGSAVAPHPSAMLEVSGNTKGFLPPRMSRENMYLIASPATGLLVFNTTDSLLFIRRDTGWVAVSAGISPWLKKADTIYNSGKERVGIGTTSPQARLHVTDSSVLFSAPGAISATPNALPTSGAGRRLMWYADKAAFRVGYTSGVSWDQGNIGNYSFASGYDTKAIGNYSTAMGVSTTAGGYLSVAMGGFTLASGDYTTAMGYGTTASGFGSTAMGNNTIAGGSYATALGSNTTANGSFSMATGVNTNASGYNSIAMGNNTTASSYYTTAIGSNTTASGYISTAIGYGLTAPSFAETSVGNYNTSYTPASTTSFNSIDRLFTIGNGTSTSATSNALVILKNGNAGIGISSPTAKLDVLGSIKLESLTNGYLTADASGNITATSFPANSNNYIQNQTTTDQAAGLRINGSALFYGGRVGINTTTPLAKLHVADSSVLFSAPGTAAASPTAPPVSGAGRRMMWYADKSAFRAGTVTGTAWDQSNVGNYSFASGVDTKASGDYSTALGNVSTASGTMATAMGNNTIASGAASTAIGTSTTASGIYTTAMGNGTSASGAYALASGFGTTAPSFAETSIGSYNTSYTGYDYAGWQVTDRLFTIGNGISPTSTSNAMVVLKNGNAGFGTSTPSARLDVIGTVKLESITNGYLTADASGNITATAFPANSNDYIQNQTTTDQAASLRISGTASFNVGNVGIGTASPAARLHVIDSSVLFSAVGNITSTYPTLPVSGAGRRMMWYPGKAAFRAGYVSGTNWDQSNIGNYSFASGYDTRALYVYTTAMGFQTTASGIASTAMGYGTAAGGNYSTTMGLVTAASAYGSTAMGGYTTASGYYTIAMGYRTTAPSYAETSIGLYNTSYTPASTNDINSNDRLFTIGNGTSSIATSDAMVVLKSGNIGIGTSSPAARLHVTDSSVLFSAPGAISATPNALPTSGAGRRLMWYADKAAFRVGYTSGVSWDQGNIGNYSFASGYDTRASNDYSTAMGYSTTASGIGSTAMGYSATASGNYSTAISSTGTTASGYGAVAIGYNTTASGYFSTSMGYRTTAPSYAETSIGIFNTSYTPASTNYINSNDRLFTIGNGSSSSATSDALVVLKNGKTGIGTSTPYSQLANTSSNILDEQGSGEDANSLTWTGGSTGGYAAAISSPQSRGLLVKTDGTSSTSNAFEVMAGGTNLLSVKGNGNVGIGTVSPSQKLTVNGNIVATGSITQNSDIRFKNEIRPLQHSLEAVMRMQGVSWKWKVNEFKDRAFTADKQIGFIAQEIEKVVPEVVFTDAQGYKSIDYAKITAVLTEAVKAQQAEIQSQQEQIANLKKELAALQQQSDVSELAKKVAQLESLLQTTTAISGDTRISK